MLETRRTRVGFPTTSSVFIIPGTFDILTAVGASWDKHFVEPLTLFLGSVRFLLVLDYRCFILGRLDIYTNVGHGYAAVGDHINQQSVVLPPFLTVLLVEIEDDRKFTEYAHPSLARPDSPSKSIRLTR